jgi:hypothetical protein
MTVGWGCGISCHGASSLHLTGCIVRHNIVHDTWGEGIIVAWGTDCVVEDNIVYDNFSVGIYNRNSQNTLNQRNFVYSTKVMNGGSQTGLGHWNEDPAFINQNNTFRNNIVFGCNRNFFYYDVTDGLKVVNNTFVNSTGFACVDIDDRAGMTNSLFANNIVIQENNLPGILVEAGSGLIFLNNLYNKSRSNSAGAGDVTADPRFIKGNVENADYFKLLSDSPAIDKGSAITDITDDFFGNKRDIIDIGACEYMKITSIHDESTKLNIIVEKDCVRISAEDSGVANLINFKGTVISSKIVNSGVVIFDTSSLLPGIYIIVYYNRNSLITKKFIVSK